MIDQKAGVHPKGEVSAPQLFFGSSRWTRLGFLSPRMFTPLVIIAGSARAFVDLACQRAKELVGAINVLPYMMKALRMWIENNQCGSDMTRIDVEWTKRILAIAKLEWARSTGI